MELDKSVYRQLENNAQKTHQFEHSLCINQVVLDHGVEGAEEIQRRLKLSQIGEQNYKLGHILHVHRDLVCIQITDEERSQSKDCVLDCIKQA